MKTFIEQFKAARTVSTPLVAIQTPDPAATVQSISEALNGEAKAILIHDLVRGIVGYNEKGRKTASVLKIDPLQTINPVEALSVATTLPDDAILFMSNAQNFLTPGRSDGSPAQAVWNLRNIYKSTGRTLVLLAP